MPTFDRTYFEKLYDAQADPWNFTGSAYEKEKYRATLDALARPRYHHILELGCSIGVLTALLARRGERLTAVDTAENALQQAQQRCMALPQVRFVRAHLPHGDWDDHYDLVVLSEVLYYLTAEELQGLCERLRACTSEGCEFMLVHWTGHTDYPMSAHQAVEYFDAAMGRLPPQHQQRHSQYRLDSFIR